MSAENGESSPAEVVRGVDEQYSIAKDITEREAERERALEESMSCDCRRTASTAASTTRRSG
jgi:hypothetical protein